METIICKFWNLPLREISGRRVSLLSLSLWMTYSLWLDSCTFCMIFILGYMVSSLSPVSHASCDEMWMEFVMNGKMILLLFDGVVRVVHLFRNVYY
jgi:hypothetical protein